MTADEITKLAAEVMTSGIKQDGARYVLPETMLIEMVRRIEAAEREACAKLLDDMAAKDKLSNYYGVAARAIRANRSQTATSAFISNRGEK